MRHQQSPSNAGKGWGPFTSRQLTTIVCVAIVAVVAIPTAAIAAVGTFTSTTATPAVKGTNSSTANNATGVAGVATAGGLTAYGVSGTANANTNGVGVNGNGKKWGVLGVSAGTALNASGIWGNAIATSAVDHFGVWGNANGTGGIGVKGTGAKYGVYSNGDLGVADGKQLQCTVCVGVDALSDAAGRTRAYAYVNADGTLDTARSRNIAIEQLTTGQYCVRVSIPNTLTIAPVVTVSDSPTFTDTVWTATVSIDQAAMADACTSGQSFLVALFKDVGGSFVPADGDFTIVVP